ncbi:MAG: hypothetical protein ABI231_03095 [Candidatus Tumulicola sp.]
MRNGRTIILVLLAVSCSLGPSPAQDAPAASSPEAFYSSAVESMRALPQPHYLTYTMEGEGDNLSIGLRIIRHLVWLEMTTGSAGFPSEWAIRHRTDDYASEITDYDGRRLVSTRAFFDPTWYGAFRALRDGMLMYQQTDAPVSSYATPTPGPSSDLRTIAVVTVIGSNVYRVEDRGAATCANGDSGHALHLISRDSDPRHQLADVTVDLRNMHFCTMRFNVRESGFSGSVEQHYESVGGYWLQTDGIIETGLRTLGIMVGHGVWRYRLTQMGFPHSIPAQTFFRPWYQ